MRNLTIAAAVVVALLTTGTFAATGDNANPNMPLQLTEPPIDRTQANACLAQPHSPPDCPREQQGRSPHGVGKDHGRRSNGPGAS